MGDADDSRPHIEVFTSPRQCGEGVWDAVVGDGTLAVDSRREGRCR